MVNADDAMTTPRLPAVLSFLCLTLPTAARASWFDSEWHFRRPIQIAPVASFDNHLTCQVEFYTDGHALPGGEDVRVATEDGKLVASQVLTAGPGDRMRVVFDVKKDVRDYAVYFGNPKPAPVPKGLDELKNTGGLLLESRQWTGGTVNNFETIEKSWDRSKPTFGRIMIDRPFIGYNPFGDQEQWISKMTGSLLAPEDGDFTLAMAVDDEGGFYLDGKPALFAHLGGADIRFHTTLHMTKGPHEFVLYQVNFAAVGFVSVGWRKPSAGKVEVIPAAAFGTCLNALPGTMEEHNKVLVADFIPTHVGECFLNDGYAFRYHFAAKTKQGLVNKVLWDFGDGQTSTQGECDHVYLHEAVYTVKLTAHAGANQDVQSNRVVIGRDYAHVIDTHQDTPATESDFVKDYNLASVSADTLPRLLALHLIADRLDAALTVGNAVAASRVTGGGTAELKPLLALEKQLLNADRVDSAIGVFELVPTDSATQPGAAFEAGALSLWWTGDADRAVKLLRPYQGNPRPDLRLLYGKALLLSGHVDEGRQILESLASKMPASRKAALSGAAARSVEYFITEKEADAGDAAWDKWMTRFPDDFLEGYSIVLRTRLMELRNRKPAAAKLAEAFAMALPKSSYAPQLLDRASKLLASSDPARSASLRRLLKQQYPEDPLSQN